MEMVLGDPGRIEAEPLGVEDLRGRQPVSLGGVHLIEQAGEEAQAFRQRRDRHLPAIMHHRDHVRDAQPRHSSGFLAGTWVAASARMPTRGITTRLFLAVGFTTMVGLHGCAAIPLAAVGASVLEAGTGAVVKTGTEYTFGGSVERTFTIPKDAVWSAVLQAFDRAGVKVPTVEVSDDHEDLEGRAPAPDSSGPLDAVQRVADQHHAHREAKFPLQ